MIIFQRVFKLQSTQICIKKHQRGNYYKVFEQELSFLYVTYRHDQIYITVKCHQNISTVFKSLSGHENVDRWTDNGQTPGSSLYLQHLSVGGL